MRLQRVGVGLGARLGLASIMTVGLVVATEQGAGAHVKWFSNFDFRDPPRTLGEVIDVGFLALLALAAVVIGALPAVDRWLETIAPYQAVNEWLNDRRHYSIDVVRYSMAAVLLITWANEALLTPELAEPIEWVGWLEFWLAIALLSGRGNQVAGVGLFVLWAIGVYQYGAFHMLDYLHVLGIGGFLLLRGEEREEVRGLALPVLYLSVGFSLMWLGFEKLVYPEWSFAILDSRPVLRLGLPAEVFLDLAAFVEIGLGFLLIIGLLGRPLALVITIVFILTTIVFGRVEVIGHTAVHAALVVFLLHGPGRTYPAPIAIHRNLAARMSFAGVNFVLLTLLIGFLYAGAARAQFDDAVAADGPKPAPVEADDPAPDVVSVRLIDAPTGTDIEVILDGWTFVPPVDASTGAAIDVDDDAPAPTEGYGIVTVDGRTVARLDGAVAPLWSNFDDDSATLLLFSPEGRQLQVDGVPLRLTIEFDD